MVEFDDQGQGQGDGGQRREPSNVRRGNGIGYNPRNTSNAPRGFPSRGQGGAQGGGSGYPSMDRALSRLPEGAANELMEKMELFYRDPRLDLIPVDRSKGELDFGAWNAITKEAKLYPNSVSSVQRDHPGAQQLFGKHLNDPVKLEKAVYEAIVEIKKNNNEAFKALEAGSRNGISAPSYDKDARENDASRLASVIVREGLKGKSGEEAINELAGVAYLMHRSYEAAQAAKTFADNNRGRYGFGIAPRGYGGRTFGYMGSRYMIF